MKNFSISKLAEIVLFQRKHLNLTQQELADKAGINRSMLCRLENQDYMPSLDQLTRLANTLQFDVTDVFIEYTAPVFHHVVSRNITVFGAGYVGLSIAVLLGRQHKVTLVDVNPEKVDMINHHVSPIQDEYISRYLERVGQNLTATFDAPAACEDSGYVIIATPTRYNPKKHFFDTIEVDTAIETVLSSNPEALMVIKSTVPIGYTASARKKYGTDRILFSPEFLRESNVLYDNLYPSRIIVGCDEETRDYAEAFAALLRNSALKKSVDTLLMGLAEAEAVKIFANTYLALRVSYFNELDTYAETNGLNTRDIIQGICLDPRIGMYYNNPSFGLGGYCLPEDTKQLLANSDQFLQNMMPAIIEGNRSRKDYIADRVLELAGCRDTDEPLDGFDEIKAVVGIFRLTVNENLHHFRHNPILGIMERIKGRGVSVIIYEPALEDGSSFFGCKVVNNIKRFKKQSDVIIANRYDSSLDNVQEKVYTRDLLYRDQTV